MNGFARLLGFYFSGERLLVSAFVLLAIYYGYETFFFMKTLDEDIVGPATFPRMLTVLAFVLCGIYWFRNRTVEEATESRGKRAVSAAFDLAPVGIALIYVLLLEELGFPLATFLFITATMRFLGEPWVRAALWGFALMLIIFVAFYYGLLANLPMGRLVPTEELLPFLVDLRRMIGG